RAPGRLAGAFEDRDRARGELDDPRERRLPRGNPLELLLGDEVRERQRVEQLEDAALGLVAIASARTDARFELVGRREEVAVPSVDEVRALEREAHVELRAELGVIAQPREHALVAREEQRILIAAQVAPPVGGAGSARDRELGHDPPALAARALVHPS